MLGPHSRSVIDFLEKKVRKSGKCNKSPPWLASGVISLLDFSLLDFKLYKTFLKLLTPIAKNQEEIWKIEGYTRDAESPKVTHFGCKLG